MKARDRRAIGVGAAVVLSVVLAVQGVPGVLGWFRLTQVRLDTARSVHARQVEQLKLLPVLEAESDSLQSAFTSLAGQFLTAISEPEAQSELLAHLEGVAGSNGTQLDQIEPLPDSLGEGRLRRVRARAIVSATLDGLLDFASRIEWGHQIMLITFMRIEHLRENAPMPLKVEVVVEAWFLRDEGLAGRV